MSRRKVIMEHSMGRIIATTLFLASIAGVGAYMMLPLLSFNELSRVDLPNIAIGGVIGLVSGIIFLVYLFKSTERFLYGEEDYS